LAGLVDDDDIELRLPRIEILVHAAQRHDPHRDRAARRGQQLLGLTNELGGALTRALAQLAQREHEAVQRLSCAQPGAFALSRPGLTLYDLSRQLHELDLDALETFLDLGHGDGGALLELLPELTPEPGGAQIAGRVALVVRLESPFQLPGPFGGAGPEPRQQLAAPVMASP
jgi:hypothetical protein